MRINEKNKVHLPLSYSYCVLILTFKWIYITFSRCANTFLLLNGNPRIFRSYLFKCPRLRCNKLVSIGSEITALLTILSVIPIFIANTLSP